MIIILLGDFFDNISGIAKIGLNTDTCEALDVGEKDWDFLVTMDVDLVKLGRDEFSWKKSESCKMSIFYTEQIFPTKFYPKKRINRDKFTP